MVKFKILITGFYLLFLFSLTFGQEIIMLPEPEYSSNCSIEKALKERRSIRDFSKEPVGLGELSQLLWACQGITDPRGFRTAPSAGALFPLEIYVVVERVTGLENGVYHYNIGSNRQDHSLQRENISFTNNDLANCALGQSCIRDAAVNILITSVTSRTERKYGPKAEKYVLIETGHAAQNICLQAQSLKLGVVTVGAFYEHKVKEKLKLDAEPIYLLAIGKPR